MQTDPKQFWEHKILHWERGRYEEKTSPSFLERIADRSSSSLRFRIEAVGKGLAPFVKGKKVVELGCGTGILAGKIVAAGADAYVGYDIAEAAITEARQRAEQLRISDKASFSVGSIDELDDLQADIVFSLGLLDWLNDNELEALFKISGSTDYLHAIAEKRFSLSQFFHRLYVHVSYGHRTGAYIPRYYAVGDLEEIIKHHNVKAVRVLRDPRLSFGAFLTNLPIETL